MKYATYGQDHKSTFDYCVLVPQINSKEILKEYITPIGINTDEVVILDLYKTGKKTPAKDMKLYAQEVHDALAKMQVKYVIVGDADYYKILTGQKTADSNLGYVHPCTNQKTQMIYVPNFRQVFYDPDTVRAKISLSLNALKDFDNGVYTPPGNELLKKVHYPSSLQDIQNALQGLFNLNQDITCDIEGFSLKHYEAGLGSIAFSTNEREGFAFQIDLAASNIPYLIHPKERADQIRIMLKDFFIHFPKKIIFHNASFDVTVLIYQLFMDHIEDTEGLLYGLEVFMEKIECTKIIAYLATNSCAGNTLGLKPLSHEFSGNYSVDEIANINKIDIHKLLQYNVVDTCSTWFVYNKYYPIMVQDNQEQVYRELFRPCLADIIQMQLTGMPICPKKVQEAKTIMEADRDAALAELAKSPKVQEYMYLLKEQWVIDKNKKLKVKRVTIADAPTIAFNPNSDKQLQGFLYDFLGLPVTAYTDSKQPSTKGDVVKNLKHKTSDEDIHNCLKAINAFKDVSIILTTFISAFEKAIQGPSGQFYLFGFFNLGGTVSGRLSSNGPNMQNIPATRSKYAKIIKMCFIAQHPWLFVGLDFASLEDRISALTTKDPNKLKVYTDGYDGHSLRAFSYFGDQMPDIDPNSVESINSIEVKYKSLRQDSKVPTFLLTYGGTHIGIIDKMGWTTAKAMDVDTKYHELYKVSDDWVQGKLDQAAIDGYVTAAFGLRVRTPLLKQVIRGIRVTPFEAEAEGRTAGNALGQSWGLLNSRAVMAFMQKVRAHPKYRLMIRPCAQIHDANYYIIRDDPELILWMNRELVKEVKWQNHPDIWHDEVKLGGELSIFYPSWAEEMKLPNELDEATLTELCIEHLKPKEKK